MSSLLTDLLARTDFPDAPARLMCAVSGGPDSTALLVLAASTGRGVLAIHVDHGLRSESAGEADLVADAARRFGADFESKRVTVEPGPNLEARARAARYSVLPPGVLTGHTADDQAETVLINLLRGAGMDGLAGMRPDGHPLLRLRRSETRALCRDLGVATVNDPSNASPDFLRNRVRNELLPLMNEIGGRDVAAVIAGQTDALRRGSDLLDSLSEAVDPTDARAVASAHPELAARAVRAWIRAETDGDRHPPDRNAVARIIAVANGTARACEIASGLRIRRSGQRLQLERVNSSAT